MHGIDKTECAVLPAAIIRILCASSHPASLEVCSELLNSDCCMFCAWQECASLFSALPLHPLGSAPVYFYSPKITDSNSNAPFASTHCATWTKCQSLRITLSGRTSAKGNSTQRAQPYKDPPTGDARFHGGPVTPLLHSMIKMSKLTYHGGSESKR